MRMIKMNIFRSRKAQGTWEDAKNIILFLIGLFVVLSIVLLVYGITKKGAGSCQGVCSNKIVKESDGSYTSLGTCQEVNEKLGKDKYKKESFGECEGGAECCINLIYDQAPKII
jgi:hypothetical protein